MYAAGARINETGLKVTAVPSCGAITRECLTRKSRRLMFRRLRKEVCVPGCVPICLDTNDPETVRDSFCSRLLRECPKVDPRTLGEFRKFVKLELRDVPIVDVANVDFEDWLRKTSYSDARKAELRLASNELGGGNPSRRQRESVSAFGKTESYMEYKHMRMINSRGDAFKAWSGPYIHALEDVVYKFYPEFVKHTTIQQRAERVRALKQDGAHYYSTDYTSFECGFSPDLMEACENALFRHSLGKWKGCEMLCRTNAGKNRMHTRTGCNAAVRGRRMSGDMWTSLGNGFTNLMIARFQAHQMGAKMSALIEGDDALIATTKPLSHQIYSDLGFIIKIKVEEDPCTASFCGLVFAESGEIIREPRRFLSTFAWTSSFVNGTQLLMDQLLIAKTLSGLMETAQCPIIGAMLRTAYDLTHHLNPRFVRDGYHSHSTPNQTSVGDFSPKMDTRVLFAEKYGIPIWAQVQIESMIQCGNLRSVSQLLSSFAVQSSDRASYDAMADFASKFIEVH